MDRQDGRVDGSSIEKKEEDRLFTSFFFLESRVDG